MLDRHPFIKWCVGSFNIHICVNTTVFALFTLFIHSSMLLFHATFRTYYSTTPAFCIIMHNSSSGKCLFASYLIICSVLLSSFVHFLSSSILIKIFWSDLIFWVRFTCLYNTNILNPFLPKFTKIWILVATLARNYVTFIHLWNECIWHWKDLEITLASSCNYAIITAWEL